jgi:hypothetical protein
MQESSEELEGRHTPNAQLPMNPVVSTLTSIVDHPAFSAMIVRLGNVDYSPNITSIIED